MTVRKSVVPKGVKKARKSAALIIAEAKIEELREDVKEMRTLLRAIFGTAFLTMLAALGALLAPFFIRGH